MLVWLALAIPACTSSLPMEPSEPASKVAIGPETHEAPSPALGELYAADEALRDVLSGELQYIGRGRWPGIERSWACAYHNERVLVVNVYCTLTEMHAFRLDVFSPARGRVRIYAEAEGPISVRDRALYFTFTAASEPAPDPQAGLPALSLAMSYDELRRYDQARYDAFLPSCYGGQQNGNKIGGCLDALAPHKAQWAARNRAFVEQANGDWYRVVRELRRLAAGHGRDPL